MRIAASCRFPEDDIPIVRGSALAALQGNIDALGKKRVVYPVGSSAEGMRDGCIMQVPRG